ncbi:MAG: PD-(D/E)XK nuclease family protein [Muribaculaceae bacterium]|nr:PD-(D/E)XK nuclease family protein [Muribaculaceae bacterium]
MRTSQPFLKSVAEAYASKYKDYSDICMLFPNKRSGRFFLKYLKETLPKGVTVVAPAIMTISDFIQMLAGRVVNSRIDSLLLLYRCYCQLRGLEVSADNGSGDDFEHFRTWGESLLQDFDEIDLYGVNAEEIFKNVKDWREISANFLTPEQRKVMTEYFGRVDMEADPDKFWREFTDKEGGISPLKQKFLTLWETMYPLYKELNKALDKEGLATTGGAYRIAAANLRRHGRKLLPWQHIGIIGFNALSAQEFDIFSRLASMTVSEDNDEPFAHFFWDGSGPVLNASGSTATRFLAVNRREFPSPEWAEPFLHRSDADSLPEDIRVIASPSNVTQAKIAGDVIAQLIAEVGGDADKAFEDAHVAVVLPDENLLLPLLYSLPEELNELNLTMGYSLRLTSTMSFVSLLRQCYMRQRQLKGKWGFNYSDLRLLLAHPFSHLLFGSEVIGQLNDYIAKSHPYIVTVEEMASFSSDLGTVLRTLASDATPSEVIDYIDEVLSLIKERLEKQGLRGIIKSRLDIAHIETYRDALRRLRDTLHDRGVQANFRTVLALTDRLLGGEQVNFEGDALKGLQVMGMLETRSLDFDTLIIPSMNERIIPMKVRRRTFIPDTLRVAYGMPPSNFQESLFAYYFFRLISRAKRVIMLYDSRTAGGGGAGELSRYVQQLRYLFAKGHLKEEECRFVITGREKPDADIVKKGIVSEKIKEFSVPGSGYNLSASALRTYCDCQARFCYENVLGLRTENESDEYMDPATQGTVLHEAIMELYVPDTKQRKCLLWPGLVLSREYLESLYSDTDRIDTVVRQCINRNHFNLEADEVDRPLTGETAMVAVELRRQIQGIIRYDMKLAPVTLLGVEIKDLQQVNIGGRMVNINMAIDRLDKVKDDDGHEVLRIIDYKTGYVGLEADNMEAVFRPGGKSKNILQLMFYAWMLNRMAPGLKDVKTVRSEIYDVANIHRQDSAKPKQKKDNKSDSEKEGKSDVSRVERLPRIAGAEINNYSEVSADFEERIKNLVDGIFDEQQPFVAACDPTVCEYCSLKTLCGV